PPVHGSPACWEQVPPLQVSAPLQKTPSLQDTALFGCEQLPLPSQTSLVQPFASVVQTVPAATKQLSAASLQTLLHSVAPQAPKWCVVQAVLLQLSLPL